MNSFRFILLTLILLFSQAYLRGQAQPNLFPNGDVENVLINLIVEEEGFSTHIEAGNSELPAYWKLSDGALLSKDEKFSGENAIRMSRGEKEVVATVFSDHWKAIDSNIPFGLPLFSQKEITISFRYKTSGIKGNNAFNVLISLGTSDSSASEKFNFNLEASKEWKLFTNKITLSELKWGGEVTFSLSGDAKKTGNVWVDDVFMSQQLDGINLIKNYSFEDETPAGALPSGWKIPIEDQWTGWLGERYRQPVIEMGEFVSGNQSIRADVIYGDCSGLAQRILLNQRETKPVVIEIWSKLDNSIGNRPPGYWGPDNYSNLTVYVYHTDGTMQEISPTFLLGESDHDWDFRRFGFQAQKPVKDILLQITVLGSEQTTSLWVDDVRAYELGTGPEEAEVRRLDIPGGSISSKWGKPEQISNSQVEVFNDADQLYLTIPRKQQSGELSIYLNPRTKSTFSNHFRYLFDVIKIESNGKVYKGTTIEKQGYTVDGEFIPAGEYGIQSEKTDHSYLLTVPFKSLGMNGVSFEPFGLNVKWKSDEKDIFWNGTAATNREMGRIILAKEPGLRLTKVEFGKRYYDEQDQSQDFITHPQLYAGSNKVEITLVNNGPDGRVEIVAGINGKKPASKLLQLDHSEHTIVAMPYQVGLEKLTEFSVTVSMNGAERISRTYPLSIPPAIEIVLDQEYYYPEEDSAKLEIYNRFRPIPEGGEVIIEIMDLKDHRIIKKITQVLTGKKALVPIDIRELRVNSLPVQDYSMKVTYFDGQAKKLGAQIRYFGKINHTKRRKLPPIETVDVDEKGRLIINGDFRFFPIVPSVKIMEWNETIDMGANVFKSNYTKDSTHYNERDMAWAKNAYTLYIGPYTPEEFERYKAEAESLVVHPGVLSTYNHQFWYWHLSSELIDFRKQVERFMGNLSSPRLVIWGHHDSSFLYDRDLPKWPNTNDPPVGYCYVKIMSRPGLGWRNTPFQTRTEQILDPERFKLAEVNYYVSSHIDAVVIENATGTKSLRADDWHGLRNESYLNIIYGANGLYHWVYAQKGQVQRLRGWFQELNYMWPVFVADDAENEVEILPFNSEVDALLKKWQGKYYLLVANRGESVQIATIRISGFEGMKVKKLFELPGSMSVAGNGIDDVWKKYDVHVYEIIK